MRHGPHGRFVVDVKLGDGADLHLNDPQFDMAQAWFPKHSEPRFFYVWRGSTL